MSKPARKTMSSVDTDAASAHFNGVLTEALREMLGRDPLSVTFHQEKKVVQAFLRRVQYHLEHGRKVVLPGFGTFHLKEWKPRMAWNPAQKSPMVVPARMRVRFVGNKQFLKRAETPITGASPVGDDHE